MWIITKKKMSKWAIFFIVLWIILILKPEIIAYVLWIVLLTIGGAIIFAKYKIQKATAGKAKKDDYFKFWEYKIYKNK